MSVQKAVIIFGLGCATIVLIIQSILDARNLTELAVRARIEQIENALANQDSLNLRKMLQEVTVYGFKNISLVSQKTNLISTVAYSDSCIYRMQFEKPLLVGDTVQIFLCVDVRTAFVLPLIKPYFWIFTILSFLLLYLSTYLPLMVFKKQTNQILKSNESGLALQKLKYSDDLQLEILNRLEQEYQNKIRHEIVEVEKVHAEKLANMAVGIAHDLRSPLSVVSLVGYKLKNDNLIEEHELLRKTCSRMQEILSEFQKEARSFIRGKIHESDNGQPSNSILKINLRETLNDLVRQKTLEWGREAQISYRISCDIEERSFVFSRVTLERHLSNLLNNSIAAMKSGGEISLSAFEKSSVVKFEVVDTGHGIDPTKLEVLGKRMVGLSEGGMGYGFFSFKQFVEGAGGFVTIQSQIGKGTKIGFSLPISGS